MCQLRIHSLRHWTAQNSSLKGLDWDLPIKLHFRNPLQLDRRLMLPLKWLQLKLDRRQSVSSFILMKSTMLMAISSLILLMKMKFKVSFFLYLQLTWDFSFLWFIYCHHPITITLCHVINQTLIIPLFEYLPYYFTTKSYYLVKWFVVLVVLPIRLFSSKTHWLTSILANMLNGHIV